MKAIHPQEFKVMALRDCPVPSDMLVCETPQQVERFFTAFDEVLSEARA